MIRESNRKSGKLLEVDFYPVFSDGRRMPTRKPKTKPSTEAQAKYNKSKSRKWAVRYINTNFDKSDHVLHTTYTAERAPLCIEDAEHYLQLYLRRVKAERAREIKRLKKHLVHHPEDNKANKKLKKLKEPLKYYIRLEEVIYKSGKNKGKSNFHFHGCISGGLDRDTMEELWGGNARVNVSRYDPDTFGPEALALYMTKEMSGRAKTFRSRSLEKPPEPKHKDGRTTRHTVELMAKTRADDREYWERRYKGYRFMRCYSRYNEYNGHWYVSVVMYKADDEPPEWTAPEWIT